MYLYVLKLHMYLHVYASVIGAHLKSISKGHTIVYPTCIHILITNPLMVARDVSTGVLAWDQSWGPTCPPLSVKEYN